MAYQVVNGPFALISMGVLVVGIDSEFAGGIFVERNTLWWKSWNMFRIGPYAWIPLWMLFAAIGIPTLLVWRLVSKFPRGHCRRCGYNLTGLTQARCPECGEGFARRRNCE